MLRCLASASLAVISAFAAPARAQVLEHLPADATNVIVAGDLLPHVQALLASPDVAAALDALAPMFEAELGFAPDAARLKQQLGLFADMIPQQIAVGMPGATVDSIYYVLQTMASVSMASAVGRGDDVAELKKALQAKARDALAGFDGVHMVMAAKMRNERAAETVFEQLATASEAAKDAGFAVERADEAVTLQADLVELGRAQLKRAMRAAGVELPEDFTWQLRVRLELRGDTLVLRIGEPAAGPLDPATLGALWSAEDPPLLFDKTESQMAEELYELQGLCAEALGSVENENAVEALVKIWEMLDNFTVFVEPGYAALRVDRGVRIDYEEELDEEVAELLAPSPTLARSFAGESGPWLLLPGSLDALLSDLCGLLLDSEDAGLVAFSEYVSGEESMLFEEGVAVVMRGAAFRGAKGLGLGEMPWGAFALVAKADGEGSAAVFMDAVRDCLSEDLAIEDAPWRTKDLGLGTETHVFDLACTPDLGALQLDADFTPHWFVVDGHLVVSTDPALSSDIAGRLRKAPTAAAAADGAWAGGRFDGAALRGVAGGVAQWFSALTGGGEEQVDAVVTALRRLLDSVDFVEVDKRPDQKTLRTRAVLRLG